MAEPINRNAAIPFLSTLVLGFTDGLKYAVVAGAVAGGGLTFIANAPNPAGLSVMKKHFNGEVSPASLFLAAVVPTAVGMKKGSPLSIGNFFAIIIILKQ